ncbi:MAG: hypothetical protein LBS85_00765 [Clostridiales Family XIII bacterium]|jgi:glucan phosphoethanolaminetransferase (alkaline phosphatase superfamily)|nr:hypothetical protein [Clostridiales Family XIII bacterium]
MFESFYERYEKVLHDINKDNMAKYKPTGQTLLAFVLGVLAAFVLIVVAINPDCFTMSMKILLIVLVGFSFVLSFIRLNISSKETKSKIEKERVSVYYPKIEDLFKEEDFKCYDSSKGIEYLIICAQNKKEASDSVVIRIISWIGSVVLTILISIMATIITNEMYATKSSEQLNALLNNTLYIGTMLLIIIIIVRLIYRGIEICAQKNVYKLPRLIEDLAYIRMYKY